jgi:hypothetical protein
LGAASAKRGIFDAATRDSRSSDLTPGPDLPPEAVARFVFDAPRGRVVMLGGVDATAFASRSTPWNLSRPDGARCLPE